MALRKTNSNRSTEEKRTLIDWKHPFLTIKKQCKLLALSWSTAYHETVVIEPSKNEINIKNAIDHIHFKKPAYGVRRIRNERHKQGFLQVGRRLVRRYMLEMNIVCFYPGPNLSKRAKAAKTYPYLLRNLKINHPNQVWSINITYIGTLVYLTAIIDWYSRYIVGYTISNTLQRDMIIRVVKNAIKTYGSPEIINSDQGSQFTSTAYIELIKSFGNTKISMDGKGRATDNIAIERFFRSYKWEFLYLLYPETVIEVKSMTKDYNAKYNNERGHQRHDYKTPAAVIL